MPSVANRLIEGLPPKARSRVLAMCEPMELAVAQVLHGRDGQAQNVYFPTGSIVSLLTAPENLPMLEVAMVGSEGMLGVHVALGVSTSATLAQVRGAGSAWRMPIAHFKSELASSPSFQQRIHRYLHVTILQGISMVRCSKFHSLNQRLARWLLMTQDRAHADTFSVTQGLMATMLGVRRVGITTAAGSLQRRAVIEYARGEITILDRESLKSAACPCYEDDRRSYSAFLS